MYFNWQYANNHGFVSWLFLGGVTSTAKAFAWPYFALAGGDENSADGLRGVRFSDVEDAELSHLFQAFEYRNEAMRVFEASANRKRGQPFNRENAILAIGLLKRSVERSRMVSDATLAKVHEDLPAQMELQFRAGTLKAVAGFETASRGQAETGIEMTDDFAKWFLAKVVPRFQHL